MTRKERKTQKMLVSEETFWYLVSQIMQSPKPNPALKKALARHKKRVKKEN
jgi:hypothetical protein